MAKKAQNPWWYVPSLISKYDFRLRKKYFKKNETFEVMKNFE